MPTLNGNSYTNAQFAVAGAHVDLFPSPIFDDLLSELDARIATVGASLVATSTSSVAIGTGSKSLTVQTSKGFSAGMYVIAYETATPANYMIGVVTSYTSGTGVLVFTVASGDTGGSGTIAAWTVVVTGKTGATGTFTGGSLSSAINEAKGADIASATTTDIGAATGNYLDITGTTTITGLGTIQAGTERTVRFTGALTLTHNATSLILPGAANITTVAGDVATFRSLGSGNWRCVAYTRTDGTGLASINQGKHAIWLPAGGWISRTTNGPSYGTTETTTNKVMASTLDFDASTAEYAQCPVQMPPSWDHGTLTAIPVWKHASTTTNFGVVWKIQGLALSNDDTMEAAFGTAQSSTDTGGTTDDFYRGPETSAITLAGTPAQNDMVLLQCSRDPSDGSDTMAIDAGLIGWLVFYTANSGTDA